MHPCQRNDVTPCAGAIEQDIAFLGNTVRDGEVVSRAKFQIADTVEIILYFAGENIYAFKRANLN
jgi:hypothetical protein